MNAFRLFISSAVLAAFTSIAATQEIHPFAKAEEAVLTLFPNEKFSIWTMAAGDLNGDGIGDFGLVATSARADSQNDERLIVLTGTPKGSYSLLSMSEDFCHARKFYNLDIKNNSLFVQGISKADSSGTSSLTLQFRYSAKFDDLRLIGTQNLSEDDEENSAYGISVNYLNGNVIHSLRKGKKQKEARAKVKVPNPIWLKGFNCLTFESEMPGLQINDDFSVSRNAR